MKPAEWCHNPQPRVARYFDRSPGYVRGEIQKMQRRLTLHEFMSKHCTHRDRGYASDSCRGWNRKAWAAHDAWKKAS